MVYLYQALTVIGVRVVRTLPYQESLALRRAPLFCASRPVPSLPPTLWSPLILADLDRLQSGFPSEVCEQGRRVLNRIYHLGYAVEDLEAASRFYEENFGVVPGEPEVVEEQGIVATMFKVGESSIELVQPTRPDSPVGKFLAKRGEGFHHVAFEVEDLSLTLAELKRNGVEVIDEEPRRGQGGPEWPSSTPGVPSGCSPS